jgi:hypothetical protein
VKRYLDDVFFERFIIDFQFLFKLIRDAHGELDLRLRNNYFNVYYRGNSMLKIGFAKAGYPVSIHQKFARDVFDRDPRFKGILVEARRTENYNTYHIPPELLHPFLQRSNINKLAANVKRVNYGEEIVFEQALITDNMNREDYFIIDRQVTEAVLQRQRLDLLGLRLCGDGAYSFEVIEVKLGNNVELRADVGRQLTSYISHIEANIRQWKENYETVYRQLKQTNIFEKPALREIVIVPEVRGRVFVSGYSGLAKGNLEMLRREYADIVVEQRENLL